MGHESFPFWEVAWVDLMGTQRNVGICDEKKGIGGTGAGRSFWYLCLSPLQMLAGVLKSI